MTQLHRLWDLRLSASWQSLQLRWLFADCSTLKLYKCENSDEDFTVVTMKSTIFWDMAPTRRWKSTDVSEERTTAIRVISKCEKLYTYFPSAFLAISHPPLALTLLLQIKTDCFKTNHTYYKHHNVWKVSNYFSFCFVKCTRSSFQTKVVHLNEMFRLPFLISFMRSTCPAHIIPLDVIILLLSERYSTKYASHY
jgi:hypothetical protein